MRLCSLGLIRYGHFTETRLNLPKPADGPDLHVIFGPNEAGKSTLLSGWLDLLYGIPARTGYNFQHDNRALRLEAEITNPSGALHLARIKGNANTLRDQQSDQPLPESLLSAALGGLGRTAYTTMFSLDDVTIEAGGESILSSQGELGELLFSASAGLAGLGTELRDIKSEAAQWFEPGKRKFTLAEHKKALADLKSQRDAGDLQASQWRKLKDTLAQAETAYAAARDKRRATQARLSDLDRDLGALRDLARLRRIERQLAVLPAPQDLPADWGVTLPDWQREESRIAALLPEAEQALAQLDTELAALPAPDRADALAPELETIERDFGAVAKELSDLPRRHAALQQIMDEMDRLAARLGRDNLTASDALLPEPTLAELSTLLDQHTALDTTCQQAQREAARARAALPEAEDSAPFDDAALARLAPLVAELRRADLLRAATEAMSAQATARAVCDQALRQLAPWQGDGAALAALDLPTPESLRALDTALAQTAQALRDARAEALQHEERGASLRAGLAEMADLSPEQVADLRAARDRAWQAHKASLTQESAQDFEAAMHADDRIRATQIEQARQGERLRALREAESALGLAQTRIAKLERRAAEHDAEVAALWARILPEAEPRSLADFTAWLARRDTALDAQAALDRTDAQAQAIAGQIQAACDTLCATLTTLGRALPNPDFATALAEAEATLAAADRLRLIEAQRRELAQRQAARAQAEATMADWQARCDDLCATCWLGRPSPAVAELRRLLPILRQLAQKDQERVRMVQRIASIDKDITQFTAQLHQIATDLGVHSEADIRVLWPRLRARLQEARTRQSARQRLRDARSTAQARLNDLRDSQQVLTRTLAPLRAQFGTAPLAEISAQLTAIEQANALAADRDALESELAETLACTKLAPEAARIEALDPAAMHAERDDLELRLTGQQRAQETAYAELSAAQKALDQVDDDARAARLQSERQTLLEQITVEAQDFLARQAGIIAFEQALRRYRDTHRSSMMAQASAAFALLTDGRYQGLTSQPDGRRDVLIAQLAEGGSKNVQDLSKGTRFQLYLALRAAGFAELAKARPLVPFIADDILETFDDTRAEAAFRLFGQMAEQGQVIYLTHHAHLCDIARRVCPTVQLHRLSAG